MFKFLAIATIAAADPTRFLSQSAQGLKPQSSFIESVDPIAKAKRATDSSAEKLDQSLAKLRNDAKRFQQEEKEFKEKAARERKEASLIH